MKREEKNLQSRQKIVSAALCEFSEKSYAEASLNTVCSSGGISKGIIYHYFKDKDELFLVCVRECFDALTAYIKASFVSGGSVEEDMQRYFNARLVFFDQNPLYFKLFYNAVIVPPQHLKHDIAGIRAEFEALNITVLTDMLKKVRLRTGVSTDEVVSIFRFYQDYINAGFPTITGGSIDIAEHEKVYSHALDIMLHGVIEREQTS